MSPIYAFSLALLIGTAALAVWRGGVWERATAAILVVTWAGTTLAPFDAREPPWVAIGLDGATMLFLLYLTIYSGRRWTIWATAFQFLLMANHLAFALYHQLEQWAYVTAYYVWGNAVLLSLVCGMLRRSRAPAATSVSKVGPTD
jgi:hypothetical protein